MTRVVFRCDGDERIGAGHVSRCVAIAQAMRGPGAELRIAGRVDGIAADLVAASGLPLVEPDEREPAGIPADADAAVVDSYEIAADDVAAAAVRRPVCALIDDAPAPDATAVLCYHLDADKHRAGIDSATPILGEAYAPVRPQLFAARRPRGFAHALVTLGGGHAGRAVVEPLASALLELDPGLSVFVAGSAELLGDQDLSRSPRISSGVVQGGLTRQIADADVAISAAGSTPYELACAGVPMLLVGLADNQVAVGEPFARAGIAAFVDARERLTSAAARQAVAALGDERRRTEMARIGPALVDGYGAFRCAAALLAVFSHDALPRVIRYRPATAADADLLLAWRNDPATRAASREQQEVDPARHAAWLTKTLANARRTLLVAESEGAPVATVRFDRSGDSAEIGVTVAPEARGRGIGAQLIRETTELYLHAHDDVASVRAEIRTANQGSLAAFERAGFTHRATSGEFEIYEARIGSLRAAARG